MNPGKYRGGCCRVVCISVAVGDAIDSAIPSERRPIYSISIASEILGLHERTLRIYEQEALLLPARRSKWRFYSEDDLLWVRTIRFLLHEKRVSIAGLRRMLSLIPCWEILDCSREEEPSCSKRKWRSNPCWVVTPRPDGKCYLCRVYQEARTYICDKEELNLIETMGENYR